MAKKLVAIRIPLKPLHFPEGYLFGEIFSANNAEWIEVLKKLRFDFDRVNRIKYMEGCL